MSKPCPVGMALWLLNGRSLVQRVEWLLRHEFRAVSLLKSVMDADPVDRREAAAAIKEAGLIVCYHANVGPTVDVDLLGRICADAEWWHTNAGGLRSLLFDPVPGDWAGCVQVVKESSRRLSPHGIRTGLENSFGPGSVYKTAADASRLQQECATPLLAHLLDVGHAHIEHPGKLREFVRSLSLEIAEVHLTDNHGVQDEHRALGAGTIDWPGFFQALHDVSYTGPLTLEVCVDILNGRYAADLKDPRQTDPILQSRDRLLSLW